jgi:hypothetical protein
MAVARALAPMAVLFAAAIAAGCSNSGTGSKSPVAIRITGSAVARSKAGSNLIADLYQAPHAKYWMTIDQDRLLYTAGIYCTEEGSKAAKDDLASDFDGLSSDGIDEFARLADADICGVMNKNGGRIP